jgi:sugar lactone lactonase YvrE
MMRLFLIYIFTCACFDIQAQVNIITTIAGKDPYGFSGDGGPASNAQLAAPYRVCYDQNANIYIADAANARIRKISKSTGIISTVAGTGIWGFSGDGGSALDAKLSAPQALATDNYDNVSICDGLNHRIRKVTASTGIITTVAGNGTAGGNGDGGNATNAELNQPAGVFVDKSGRVFIADWANKKVRIVNPSTGMITTFAGSGGVGYSGDGGPAVDATINAPLDVYADTNGNMLISDQYNHRIRKVDASTGVITTIAGNGTVGYAGDGGLAINARLDRPSGLFVDKQNNIYIAEYGNGTVRKIDAVTGIITTVAGTGTTGFSGDGGPATDAKLFCSDVFVDQHGNLIIADYENNRIRKVNNAVAVTGIDKAIESKLYPNPTKGVFTVQTPVNFTMVSVYNIGGVKVYEQTCTTANTEIDISTQPPGVYMVYVQCGEGMWVSKVVRE